MLPPDETEIRDDGLAIEALPHLDPVTLMPMALLKIGQVTIFLTEAQAWALSRQAVGAVAAARSLAVLTAEVRKAVGARRKGLQEACRVLDVEASARLKEAATGSREASNGQ